MAENKTQQNDQSVEAFLNKIEDTKRREDCYEVLSMMQRISGEIPKMWGDSIVGFGKYFYRYKSGKEGNWFKVGFSPRKQNLTLYIMPGFEEMADIMQGFGKYKTGKSCLYIKRLEDVNRDKLEELIRKSLDFKYGLQ